MGESRVTDSEWTYGVAAIQAISDDNYVSAGNIQPANRSRGDGRA